MGTNYYRIPTQLEMEERKAELIKDIADLDWDMESAWDRFTKGTSIHLGKRSAGWKFCWNFHNNKYYSNKEELIQFVLSGRVVNEYGDKISITPCLTFKSSMPFIDSNSQSSFISL